MRELLTGLLAVIMLFTLLGQAAFATQAEHEAVTYQIAVNETNAPTEILIPEAGEGTVYHRYEAHAGEEMSVSVTVTLTIDENGNIVG